jgi:hypothetical protein
MERVETDDWGLGVQIEGDVRSWSETYVAYRCCVVLDTRIGGREEDAGEGPSFGGRSCLYSSQCGPWSTGGLHGGEIEAQAG